MRLRLLAVAVLAAASGAAACAGILGFERLSVEGGFVLEAGADDEAAIVPLVDGGADAADPCSQIGIPDVPTDASAAIRPDILAALKLLDFGVGVDGGAPDAPGFNLDRVCSVDLASSSCTTHVLEPTFDHDAKDKSATGLDNAGFSLIEYISSFSTLLSAATINQGIQAGRYGLVLKLASWNGAAEDNDVALEIFPAIGVEGADGRTGAAPGFTANDRWLLDDRFEVAAGVIASKNRSDQAWVTGGKLLARFKQLTIPILLDVDPKPFDIMLSDAILEGTLTTTNGATSLTAGVLAGRWKTSDFLGQVRTIFVKNANGLVNTVLCENVPNAQLIYGGVKGEVCDARDIRSDSQDQAKLPCDAISAALRIEAYPITTLGDFDAGPTIAPRCQDAAVPAGDDCAL